MPNTIKVSAVAAPAVARLKGAVVLLVAEGRTLDAHGKALDKHLGGRITAALKAAPRFKGAANDRLTITAAGGGITHLSLLGIGKPKTASDWNNIGGNAYAMAARYSDSAAVVIGDIDPENGAAIATGAAMKSYRFDKYKTKLKAEDKPSLKTVSIAVHKPAAAKKPFADALALADGISFCRDMGHEPPNVLNPVTAAKHLQQLKKRGIKVTVIDDKQMKKLGMGCMLAVGAGSETPPRLVLMEYRGARNKKAAPLALVGKGITFDTGGINIKLDFASLHEMKFDMMGAANVCGLMMTLAKRKAKVNVIGAAAFAENAVDEDSYRPSDVLTSMSGITVDVWNTDAEGRLVLSDAMWYTQEKYKPHTMIDMATLTGASIIALAHEYGALISNDDKLAQHIYDMGEETGDRFWRLPCGPELDKYIKSSIADISNLGVMGGGRAGGTITAARFLHNFVQKGVKWAHLDIANVDNNSSEYTLGPAGPTAHGVRMINALIAKHYED